MGNSSAENLKVRITPDGMEAYLSFLPSSEEAVYEKEDLVKFLNSQKVVFGLDEEELARVAKKPIYHHDVCVAKGMEQIDGEDGFMTYHFDTEPGKFELVREGDVIAVRTEPTQFKNGMTVSAKPLVARRGKEAEPLKGKGFHSPDGGHTYVADRSGRIEFINGGVHIFEVYEVDGNVEKADGIIDFHGDVVIHGNVTPGSTVKASGSIIVEGFSENCTVEAGKDIFLRGGVLGGNKTTIHCGGNIHAKFFEYCKVYADGSIEAESALDSQLESRKTITLTGKKTCLVGGRTYAIGGIKANSIGNSNEIKTLVQVGATAEMLRDVYDAKQKLAETEEILEKINAGLEQYDEFAAEHGSDEELDEKRVELFRTRMREQAVIASLKKEISHLEELIEWGKHAAVKVVSDVYRGTDVTIGRYSYVLQDTHSSVKFLLSHENVAMIMYTGD